MVLGGGEGHVVDDGGDVAEDGGIEQGGGDHQEKAKQLKWNNNLIKTDEKQA